MDFTYNRFNEVVDYELYLCNPDMTELGVLQAREREVTLRYNDLSELTFEVPKVIKSQSGEIIETPYYNLIETRRLIYVTDIGYFRITEVSEEDNGADVYKSVSCESHQTMFKDFGFTSEEKVYKFYNYNDPQDTLYDSNDDSAVPSIVGQMCQQLGVSVVSKATIDTDKTITTDYGNWTVAYVTPSLIYREDEESNVCRTFSEETTNGYDFLRNDVEDAFEIIIDFDFKYHAIKVYTVEEVTESTNVYLSHQNLLTSVNVTENADNLVTVMTMEGSDDLDISLVNPSGTKYKWKFDYYKQKEDDYGNEYPWMSKELIAAIDEVEANFDTAYDGDYTFYDDDGEVDTTPKTNAEAYKAFVLDLKELYQNQAELSEQITYVNTKLKDLSEIISELASGDATGGEIFTAEEVEVGETSLCQDSEYYSKAFDGTSATYTFYEDITRTYHEDYGVYTFTGDESDASVPDVTPEKMVASDGDIDAGGDDVCPYFFEANGVVATKTTIVNTEVKEDEGDSSEYSLTYADDGKIGYTKLTVKRKTSGTVAYVYIKYKCKNLISSGSYIHNSTVVQFNEDEKSVTQYAAISGTPSEFVITKVIERIYTVETETTTAYLDPASYCKLTSKTDSVEVDDDGNSTVTYAVEGFTRYTTYNNAYEWKGWYDDKLSQLNASYNLLQNKIDAILSEMEDIAALCNIVTYFKANYPELIQELYAYWSLGDYTNDNYAVLDSTTMAEQLELAEELMESGETELKYASQPEYSFTAEGVNFLFDPRYKSWAREIKLGNVVTVERADGLFYYPALTEITFNLDDRSEFSMTFSNNLNLSDWAYTWGDMVESASSTSKTVDQNWGSLTSYSSNKDTIQSLLYDPLNATLRLTQRNLYNQDFVIDETGILGRKYTDDSKTDFEDEQVRMTNNVIIFTDDGWQSIKTALGKVVYDTETGDTAYGLLAEVIVGDLIMGSTLKIKNESNTVAIDGAGITLYDSAGDAVFYADEDGNLTLKGAVYATSGEFKGTIYAYSGEIGDLSISTDGLYYTDKIKINGATGRIYVFEDSYMTMGTYCYMDYSGVYGYYHPTKNATYPVGYTCLDGAAGISQSYRTTSTKYSSNITLNGESLQIKASNTGISLGGDGDIVISSQTGGIYLNSSTSVSGDLSASGNFTSLGSTASIVGFSFSEEGILPSSNQAYDLGSSDCMWDGIYGRTIKQNGVAVSSPYATTVLSSTTMIINRITCGQMKILCIEYKSSLDNDEKCSFSLSNYVSTIYSVQVVGRLESSTESLSGNSHTGGYSVYVSGQTIYVANDYGSSSQGFYVLVIGI